MASGRARGHGAANDRGARGGRGRPRPSPRAPNPFLLSPRSGSSAWLSSAEGAPEARSGAEWGLPSPSARRVRGGPRADPSSPLLRARRRRGWRPGRRRPWGAQGAALVTKTARGRGGRAPPGPPHVKRNNLFISGCSELWLLPGRRGHALRLPPASPPGSRGLRPLPLLPPPLPPALSPATPGPARGGRGPGGALSSPRGGAQGCAPPYALLPVPP